MARGQSPEPTVAELERECAELRRRLAAAERTSSNDAAAFLESLLGAVPAFIIRTDADMRIIYMNRVQPGLDIEEVLGREIDDFLHPDSIAPVVEGIRIFAGYSGWTIGQLEGEIERDDWIVLSALPSDVLVEPKIDLWSRVLRRQPLPLSLLATHPIDVSRN